MRLGQVIISPIVIVQPDTSIKDAALLLTEKRTGALPVVHDEGLVGIVFDPDLIDLETNPDCAVTRTSFPTPRRLRFGYA
jgi:CBS domain-containing protein